MSWPDDNLPRFVVGSVTGAFIDPESSTKEGAARPMPTSYYVQDRAYCFRVVAAFESPRDATKRGALTGGSLQRLQLAKAAADELNARDEAA